MQRYAFSLLLQQLILPVYSHPLIQHHLFHMIHSLLPIKRSLSLKSSLSTRHCLFFTDTVSCFDSATSAQILLLTHLPLALLIRLHFSATKLPTSLDRFVLLFQSLLCQKYLPILQKNQWSVMKLPKHSGLLAFPTHCHCSKRFPLTKIESYVRVVFLVSLFSVFFFITPPATDMYLYDHPDHPLQIPTVPSPIYA